MLRSFKHLEGLPLHARDGTIGHTDDLLFDDKQWTVRYVVVKTGGLLKRKRVLISPLGIAEVDWTDKALKLRLTRQQIEDSPDVDTDAPVFRQMESLYFDYYGWPYYWTGIGIWGINPANPIMSGEPPPATPPTSASTRNTQGDPHLRSCRALHTYFVEAEGKRIGQVGDFLFEDGTWTIRYLVIDPKGWWHSDPILIAPKWIQSVDWRDRSIQVDLEPQAIKDSPRHDPHIQVTRTYEDRLYGHYRRPKYWEHQSP